MSCDCIGGFLILHDVGNGSAARCPKCQPSIEGRLRSGGVPAADLAALFGRPWQGAFPDAEIAAWPKESSLLTISGVPGAGKTRTALELLRRELEAGQRVRFIAADDLLAECKARMREPGSFASHLLEVATFPGVLVLDDCWSGQATEFNDATISQIIRRRYADKRPLIITTDLSEEDLEREEPRLASRISGSVTLPLVDRDWRKRA